MSEWVTDSMNSKLLWLPPNWRTQHGLDVEWDSDFLALVGSHHKKPIIIKLLPQILLPPHMAYSVDTWPHIWPLNPKEEFESRFGLIDWNKFLEERPSV